MSRRKNTYEDPYLKALRVIFFVAYLYLLKHRLPNKEFVTRSDLIERLSDILELREQSIINFIEGTVPQNQNTELAARLFLFTKSHPIIAKPPATASAAASEIVNKELVNHIRLKMAISGTSGKKELEQLIKLLLADPVGMSILNEICPKSADFWLKHLRLL